MRDEGQTLVMKFERISFSLKLISKICNLNRSDIDSWFDKVFIENQFEMPRSFCVRFDAFRTSNRVEDVLKVYLSVVPYPSLTQSSSAS